jgi:hypothetical protein
MFAGCVPIAMMDLLRAARQNLIRASALSTRTLSRTNLVQDIGRNQYLTGRGFGMTRRPPRRSCLRNCNRKKRCNTAGIMMKSVSVSLPCSALEASEYRLKLHLGALCPVAGS